MYLSCMIKCNKCDGKGHLGGFAHIAQGVCFQCKGTGKLSEPKKATVTYSRAFTLQYYHTDLFPEGMAHVPVIKILGMAGHPTAECRLILHAGFYYIGQPVCRASRYYKIPVDEYNAFVVHYNRANKSLQQL